MKIASWNVNSIRSRLNHVIDWLDNSRVDVLCLQETKVVDQDFPQPPFLELGYHLAISGQKGYNGVAIISRSPLTQVQAGFQPLLGEQAADLDSQKRLLAGVIEGVQLVNLYVPNGSTIGSDKYTYKLHWLRTLRDYLHQLVEEQPATIICGDFNIALENRDIHDPELAETHIMASLPERGALQSILDVGFKDVFRKFTSERGHYSWWDYREGSFRRNRGWRIDHIYATSLPYDTTIGCTIDLEPRRWTKPSDHTPVVMEL
ncbi:MAG: exodeoxyribonuclease III [Cyanobacteria bacterium WB6_1B_304]|nr:exodeoxyribonuclease III [Cyanobacteria bacterium WB6_1B_304]